MGAVAGRLQTTNIKNYVGPLYFVTPSDHPFLTAIGGLNGGKRVNSTLFTWQTMDNAAAAQDVKLEGADATFSGRDRTDFSNVLQIHQEGFSLTYTAQGTWDMLASDANLVLGNQPVKSEKTVQAQLKLEKIGRDVDYSFLRGTFANPADPTVTARQTRGLQAAITTNAVAAGSTDLAKTHIDTLVRTMADNGAPFRRLVFVVPSFNAQRFDEIYGYQPESWNIGGVVIERVNLRFAGPTGILYDRHMVGTEVYAVDLAYTLPVFLNIPGKPPFFMEPLSKAGSADKWQFYGEIGLEYGPEQWHGKITGTTSS